MIQRHRSGCVWLDGRTWWFRAGAKSKAIKLGSLEELKNKSAARKAAQPHVSEANDPQTGTNIVLNAVIKKYREDELPKVRQCTSRAYECWLENYIIPKWGRTPIVEIEGGDVKDWLDGLTEVAGKTRAEIRGIMRRLLEFAMLRKLMKQGPNPVDLVRLRDVKRKSKPRLLTVDEFSAIVAQLEEPFKTMACFALFHGLRVSELLGLKWGDINWLGKTFTVQRSIVCQVEELTKTEASQADLPLEDEEIAMLQAHRSRSEAKEATDYIFASPHSGYLKPYHYTAFLWKLEGACTRAKVAKIGTHTFRHTARAWAGQAGVSVSVMKDLLRHADIRTTMNVYGGTVQDELRSAHSKVVRMANR